jgi:hypothetical protein
VSAATEVAERLIEALDPLIGDATEMVLAMDARFERDHDQQISRWREKVMELLSAANYARREASLVIAMEWLESETEDAGGEAEDEIADAEC